MRWLAVLFTLAACGSGANCPPPLQVCLVSDSTGCRYVEAACCGTAWTCSQGVLMSSPATCLHDASLTEACL
jgi:hypothetical protein